MAEPRLTPDPYWLVEFEAAFPGDPRNEAAALGIAYLNAMWTEAEARAYLDRVFDDSIREIRMRKLEGELRTATSTEQVLSVAKLINEIRQENAA